MVFVLCQLQEQCQEQNKGLYVTFADLTKAFNSVSRTGIWLILKQLVCPQDVLQMVIRLLKNQRGQITLNGDLSEPFLITDDMKKFCVLALTLFGIFISMMLMQVTADLDEEDGVYVMHCVGGSLFNLHYLQTHFKTQERLIRDLLFADNALLVAHTEQALQRITSCFVDASQLFGLHTSLMKTEVLHQPILREEYHPPHITIGNVKLKSTQQFSYLGGIVSSDARIYKEIDNRPSKANGSFDWLYKRV